MANFINVFSKYKSAIGIGTGAAIAGGAIGYAVARIRSSKARRKKRKSSPARRKVRRRARGRRGRRTPRTAGKRRDTSRRRIRYTKKGQPYVIVAGGKARFIKKTSASSSRKRRGGKY